MSNGTRREIKKRVGVKNWLDRWAIKLIYN